ncbi:hypothetical protein DDB_G0278227 [Dictyostelium discoideum AX4]|uniref:Intimal thickness related receptor IRP domain-containing protein n=1 Tax=Dictyostelium discoideum TaxID=44689 RepID=Q54YI0_DICDI|nr:hypothetical protein DDB_G0278227 [Dictyostelium discoideum AX4]EAL68286.1 hypothetical protein DDB_G0278227 [Dictyostelium discoideum AX4]|eukprot:XP_642222.1 hypothetical protein DDB_G0278227 [Dictyostelium discoideum AX4]
MNRINICSNSRICSNSIKFIILITTIILLLFLDKGNCMIYDREFSFSGNYYMVEQYGYDSNGFADINIKKLQLDGTIVLYNTTTTMGGNNNNNNKNNNNNNNNTSPVYTGSTGGVIIPINNITLWICQDRDYQSVIGSTPTNTIETKLCDGTATLSNCPINNIPLYQGFKGTFDIPDSDMYRVIILKCTDTRTASIDMSFTLTNRNGQLEKGYLQLPLLYRYIMIIFCCLFFTVTIFWYCHKSSLNILHIVLYIVLVLKLILIIVQYSFWTDANNLGTYSMALWYIQNIFYSFSETAFFLTLFILSRGLRVTRQTLSRSELKAIFVVGFFLCGVLLFFRFYNDIYYFLSLMILYFFMMPKIFTNITKNLRILYSHSILSRYINNLEQVNNLSEKKRVFTNLRTSVVLYLGAILFVNSLRIVMVWSLYWLAFTLSEPIFILMISFLCYSFKPNNTSQSIFRNPNLDAVDFSEIAQNIQNLLNPVDPVLLSTIMEIRSFDPTTCHIIKYPSHQHSKYSLAVLEQPTLIDNNNNNDDDDKKD